MNLDSPVGTDTKIRQFKKLVRVVIVYIFVLMRLPTPWYASEARSLWYWCLHSADTFFRQLNLTLHISHDNVKRREQGKIINIVSSDFSIDKFSVLITSNASKTVYTMRESEIPFEMTSCVLLFGAAWPSVTRDLDRGSTKCVTSVRVSCGHEEMLPAGWDGYKRGQQ